jgi:hypothetical protein
MKIEGMYHLKQKLSLLTPGIFTLILLQEELVIVMKYVCKILWSVLADQTCIFLYTHEPRT